MKTILQILSDIKKYKRNHPNTIENQFMDNLEVYKYVYKPALIPKKNIAISMEILIYHLRHRGDFNSLRYLKKSWMTVNEIDTIETKWGAESDFGNFKKERRRA